MASSARGELKTRALAMAPAMPCQGPAPALRGGLRRRASRNALGVQGIRVTAGESVRHAQRNANVLLDGLERRVTFLAQEEYRHHAPCTARVFRRVPVHVTRTLSWGTGTAHAAAHAYQPTKDRGAWNVV